jgi:type IV secretory pathway VirB10-like protein
MSGSMNTEVRSPDVLGAAPGRGAGVRRLNRMPLVFAFVAAAIILGAVTYTYQMRLADQRRKAAEAEARPEPANVRQMFRDAPDGGLIPAAQAPEEPKAEPAPAPDPGWEELRQRQAQRQQVREQATLQALSAPTTVSQGLGQRPSGGGTEADPANATALLGGDARRRPRWEAERDDLNGAEAKRRFLADGAAPQGRDAHVLASGREPPLSPYEVKAGTVIPAVMIGGINSDLPGQLLAQVSETVYDTATGRFALIPQGARLVGTYDNSVTTGQERVLVAWTRILYPDASSVDLGKMPGADEGGYAGFHDQVNDHFWKTFGNALMLSLFSSGVQLSQGQGNGASSNGMNAQQTMAASLGQQMGQLGMETARRNMQVQPTLEIRPGYRFDVMVTKDISGLRPWRAERRKAQQ